MELKTELHDIKTRVDVLITEELDDLIAKMEDEDALVVELLTYYKSTILSGGKRLRPAMVLYGYQAAGGVLDEKVYKAAVGIEFIHSFLLIHDDIIDRDDLRHGEKTMHAYCRDRTKMLFGREDGEHFGMSSGIILGDFIHCLGNKMIFASGFDSEVILRTLTKLQNVVQRTAIGQFQDVVLGYKNQNQISPAQVINMYKNKTARYTFEGPLHMGAILAGADEAFCESLSAFAIPLGIAFQIQDDFLGVYGDPEKTGKPVGSDITEGKMTLLVIEAYANADHDQKEVLDRLLGKSDISHDELVDFRCAIEGTDAHNLVKNTASQQLEEAATVLDQLDITIEAKEFFAGLIAYLESREV